jgi:hypothetical protein
MACVAMLFDKISPSRQMDAAVSSQEDSMASMVMIILDFKFFE